MSKKQTTQQTTTNQSNQGSSTSTTTGSNGPGNQAINQMTPGAQGQAPAVNLSGAQDANGFMSAASAALDAAVPTNGSFTSLTVTGNIPLWKDPTGTAGITLSPSINLQAARAETGEFEVTIGSSLALTAKAEKDWGWFGSFEAFITAKASGSLKIKGDSATEIFREFMLTLREIIDGACDAASVPNDIADMLRQGIMSDATRSSTIKNMDENDGVTATFGVGGEVGGKWGDNSASVGVDYTHTTELKNTNGDDQLETTSNGQTSVTVKGSFKPKKLPVKSITPSVTFVFAGGGVSEVFVGLASTGEMTSDKFSELALMSTEWAVDMGMGLKSLIQDALGKTDRSKTAQLSTGIDALSFGSEAVTYTAFGEQLKSWAANNTDFQDSQGVGQSGQKIEFGMSAQAGWSKKKSWNAKGGLTTAKSWSLGSSNTPIQIEAKSGQTIASAKTA